MPYQQAQTFAQAPMESEDDRKLLVRFFMDAVEDPEASAREGRPIFRDAPMISIITPGSRDEYIAPATAQYRNRFPRHWAAFTQHLEDPVQGTPLKEVPFLTVAQVKSLQAINCITLEQLAGMSDAHAGRGMGLIQLRDRAKAYLAAAKDAAPITALQNQLEEREAQIKAQEQRIARLEAQLEKMMETED